MFLLFIWGLSIATVTIIAIVAIRLLLKRKSKELSLQIDSIKPYQAIQKYREETSGQNNECFFINIENDLEHSFSGQFITFREEKQFTDYYKVVLPKVDNFLKRLEIFHVEPSSIIAKFVSDFENIHLLIKSHNKRFIQNKLDTHKEFFDHCLKYPLDKQQRRSIVSEEDNCLVISSAGSGKTSSIVGKVKYLTEIKGVKPQRILLISYTNKAAAELTERMATDGLKGYTFHKLAIDIIGRETGIKPSICDNTDALFVEIYHNLLKDSAFKKSVVEYFIDYSTNEAYWEQRMSKRREQLSELKNARLKAMFPDMDGKTIYVRSEQEQKICFVLSSLGVKFKYEQAYEHQLADEMHSQYRPDFSIYFEKEGVTKRIYLEHFGIDDHSLVPVWFAKDKNITYEEANQKYNDGITWKKAAHEKFGTQLLVTSSADFHYSDIRNKIRTLLKDADVPIQEKTDEELYDLVLPKGGKQEKAFIRLVVTFITLIKSSCKSINEIFKQAYNANDERSVFIIKNIFQPVYDRYVQALNDSKQIDFTDIIIQATEICRKTHPVEYDYIIVDEFQDISVDRYNFLKVLREGNPPAKLYCVGDDWQSIYRFSGSDMTLFSQFPDYFGATEINKIETTYRFGEPLVAISSQFIQRNNSQIKKDTHSFSTQTKTDLMFHAYERKNYCDTIWQIIAQIPLDKSIFLLGRYSFDDYYLSFMYKSIKRGSKFFYVIGGREIEFLTVHKSKGLEADYVIILQCNKDTYGFPSLISGDQVLNYVLTKSDTFPFSEERRLFYVAITRAKTRTIVLYDNRSPSVFVNEFLHPKQVTEESCLIHPNANKRWTRASDQFLLKLYHEGKSVKYIATKMGRSQTSIVMRLGKLNQA